MESTLFVTVGRDKPRPLCSSESLEILAAVEQQTLSGLIAGGNDPERIIFEVCSGNSLPVENAVVDKLAAKKDALESATATSIAMRVRAGSKQARNSRSKER